VKLRNRVLLILLLLLVVLQLPFIYRRYQTANLAEKIAELQSQRVSREDPGFKEYKGVIHVHTSVGGHSTGGFPELIAAANSNDLDFVLMTEHAAEAYNTSALTLNGVYGKTLFIGGNEMETADEDTFLMIPGSADAAALKKVRTDAVIQRLHNENRLALITYPEKFNTWNSDFDGDEVFSNHTELKKANPLLAAGDLIWSFSAYPELTLMSYIRRPDANLQKFDEIAAQRRVTLFAGTDAHSNIGILVGDDTGHKFVDFKLDPYATILHIARAHLLLEKDKPLTSENLIAAMKAGRTFIGFDCIGDTTGFMFKADSGGKEGLIGDELPATETAKFMAAAPEKGRFIVFKNGKMFFEATDTSEITFDSDGPGAYRVEVYLDQLGSPFDNMPWIISNPIYVR
jgi:hypothetical protein